MPTYEYLCDDHGALTAFKPISQYKDPEPCPECAVEAPRVMLTAPVVRGASKPDSGGGAKPAWMNNMRKHSGGCACC
jgi:putative FmdB family regulatory protein